MPSATLANSHFGVVFACFMSEKKSVMNVALLACAQAMANTQMVLIFTVSGLIGATIAPDARMATVPITLQFLAMMASTVPAAYTMRAIGRAPGFIAFVGIGAIGVGIALWGVWQQDFWLFCLGSIFFGFSQGSNQQLRFAAVDVASPTFKSRAVSLVLAGGVFAGLAGPTISTLSVDMLGTVTFGGAFVAIFITQVIMVALLMFTDIPRPTAAERAATGRPFGEIARQPMFIVALLSAMLGYGVMNFVMLSTPLIVVHSGHTIADSNDVIMWHVLGMFLPSFVTGWLIKKYGDLNIIAVGAVLALVCLAVNLSGHSLWHFRIAMALVGVGWNFMFTGGTTLLTETYTPAEKAKVQGINDFIVFGTVAMCSLAAGTTYQWVGWTAVNIAVFPALAIVLGANMWMRLQCRTAVAPAE